MDIVQRWSFIAQQDNDVVADWLSFKLPGKRDFDNLVEHDTVDRGEFTAWMGEQEHRRRRDGFKLTDPRFNQRQVLSEVNHCIYCHERDTDSCSKGMRNKKTNTFKVDPLGVTTIGCPLDEKISRNAPGQAQWRQYWRVGNYHHRQSDVSGYRTSYL